MAGFCSRRIVPHWRAYVLVLTPLVFLPLVIISYSPEARCGYGIIVMAIYWMTEALPLPVTSLLPVVIFPLFGILSTDAACKQYLKETNMMFIGGLIVAIAVEHCCLHKRIALKVLLTIGTGPKRLMFGFMLVTMFLSMWISNTATTAMMMPIVEAVLDELFRIGLLDDEDVDQAEDIEKKEKGDGKRKGIYLVPTCETTLYDSKDDLNSIDVHTNTISMGEKEWKSSSNGSSKTPPIALERAKQAETKEALRTEKQLYRTVVMLSVAYSANIGGTGTMTGSGPNLVLKGMLAQRYGSASGLNFATWMLFGVPTMLLCIIGAFIWLVFLYTCRRPKIEKQEDNSKFVKQIIQTKYDDLGPITFHEVGVLLLFILVVLLWFFRDPQFISGWMHFFPAVEVDDASAAILVCLLFFSIPATINFWCFRNRRDGEVVQEKPGPSLLEWKVVQQKMPWGVVILLGGGFSMAEASKVSGLSNWMGQQLLPLQVLPPAAIAFVVSIMTAAFTEVTSNVATATVLLPVLADLATSLKVHPLYLMFPATITCSYAFMLPIATPPNAIAFSSGHMKSEDMLFPGLFMNFICVGVITLTINTLGVLIFDLNTFPEWATANLTAALLPSTATIKS